jgi:hypothetical protein
MAQMRETLTDWSHGEFGHADIGDPRWRTRLVGVAMQAARCPAGRITEVFSDDAQRQGAYGLLESEKVAPTDVAEAMFVASARRCAEEEFVFCPVDGTSLTLTDRDRCKDFGPIGTRAEGARGIKVINAMALSPLGVPLGVCAQQWWTRPENPRRKHRDSLTPRQKETGHWLDAMAQVRKTMAEFAPSVRIWFQVDREADSWSVLTQAAQEGHWFTIRASHNRRVSGADGKLGKLRSVVARQPVQARYQLAVRGGPKRKARSANLEIRACSRTLHLRDKKTGKRTLMAVNLVQARERGTTPRGEKPIVWTLLTNHAIETLKDLTDVLFGYSMRWRIEELHKAWKSSACRVEETQLRSASAVIKWATILIAVAVRIERIKQLSREEPERPASVEFTPVEIRAAALLHFGESAKTRVPRGVIPSIAEVTLWIAKIGGYTGQTSSGGPPGSITISRGLDRVRSAAKALSAAGL